MFPCHTWRAHVITRPPVRKLSLQTETDLLPHPALARRIMRAAAALLLLLANVEFSSSCDAEGRVLICRNFPAHFSAGYLTLAMYVTDVGEINSTVLHSDALASVTRLRMDNAGVTAVAEVAFGSFLNLTSVSLTRNLLTHVTWRWFGRPDVLTELSLTENRIRALNRSQLSGLVSLAQLRLNKNRITTLGLNTFLSQVHLMELDLSENRMTRLSPQLLGALRSTRVGLDRNPWDCSCGAEDWVALMKDLHSRAQLDRPMEVSCHTPPALSGQPVWNVTACTTPSGPGSTSEAQSAHTEPTDGPVSSVSSDASPIATHVTSPSSETHTETSVTSHLGGTEKCGTSDTVWSLIFVIGVLCASLCVLCFLTLQHRRKRSNDAVAPVRQKEERNEMEEERRSSPARSAGRSENRDPEEACRRPFTGVRAKSANAVFFIAPFGICGKNQVSDTDAQSQDAKKKLEHEAGATRGNQEEGGSEANEKRSDDGNKMEEASLRGSVGADALPYLSISIDQNQPDPQSLNRGSTDSVGQRSHVGKGMGRISTWPPTAGQWQERGRMKEGDMRTTGNKQEQEMKDLRPQVHMDRKQEDPSSERRAIPKTPNQNPPPAGSPATAASSQSEQRAESRQAAGAEHRRTGSKAPPGGASPDGETLLCGNENAFMDLLHEVVQNNGRWTRERWRQIHVNKQRR